MKTIGFMVIDACEDWEQPLGLKRQAGFPDKGLLEWTHGSRAVFSSRRDARAAIERTHHYAKAFDITTMPDRKFCKIVPVAMA